MFFIPAAAHTEKDGSFTNTQRLLQWHRPGGRAARRCPQRAVVHLSPRPPHPREVVAVPPTRDRPAGARADVGLPDTRRARRTRRRSGARRDQRAATPTATPLSTYTDLRDDGSTTCGCWIYCGVHGRRRQPGRRRTPGDEQDWVAPEWGWAWPANRRILYNRASADPDGTPWSERKTLRLVGRRAGEVDRGRRPRLLRPTRRPTIGPADDATGSEALAGNDPFIMQADGKAWLYVPAGSDRRSAARRTTSPRNRRCATRSYDQQCNPACQVLPERDAQPLRTRPRRSGQRGLSRTCATTYRLTEHYTAGGMSRWLAVICPSCSRRCSARCRPSSPRSAGLEHTRLGDRSIIAAGGDRGAGARHGTDDADDGRRAGTAPDRLALPLGPQRVEHRRCSQRTARTSSLDPNVHIQEVKAFTCDYSSRPPAARSRAWSALVARATNAEPHRGRTEEAEVA